MVVLEQQVLDLRGKKLSSYLSENQITFQGVKFSDELIHPKLGGPLAKCIVAGQHYVVTFERPLYACVPDQTLRVEFVVLDHEQVPAVTVDPDSVRLNQGENLASQVLAHFAQVIIRRNGDLVEFVLEFNERSHERVIGMACQITDTRKLSHFLNLC